MLTASFPDTRSLQSCTDRPPTLPLTFKVKLWKIERGRACAQRSANVSGNSLVVNVCVCPAGLRWVSLMLSNWERRKKEKKEGTKNGPIPLHLHSRLAQCAKCTSVFLWPS